MYIPYPLAIKFGKKCHIKIPIVLHKNTVIWITITLNRISANQIRIVLNQSGVNCPSKYFWYMWRIGEKRTFFFHSRCNTEKFKKFSY